MSEAHNDTDGWVIISVSIGGAVLSVSESPGGWVIISVSIGGAVLSVSESPGGWVIISVSIGGAVLSVSESPGGWVIISVSIGGAVLSVSESSNFCLLMGLSETFDEEFCCGGCSCCESCDGCLHSSGRESCTSVGQGWGQPSGPVNAGPRMPTFVHIPDGFSLSSAFSLLACT